MSEIQKVKELNALNASWTRDVHCDGTCTITLWPIASDSWTFDRDGEMISLL